jgi:hypothetical protein
MDHIFAWFKFVDSVHPDNSSLIGMTPTTSNGNQLLPQQTPQLVSYRKRKYQNSATSDNDFSDVNFGFVFQISNFLGRV